jgi:phosphopantetheinyl transferase (holo-ACP synthase)
VPGVGVDIVDLARMRSSRLAGRICTDVETAWINAGDPVVRLAACFALKEACIKAHGGRPPGFDWRTFGYDPVAAAIAGLPAVWGAIADDVVAVVGSAAAMVGASAEVGENSGREAGRVAGHSAVRAFVAEGAIDIVPGEHPADDPTPCRGSHPPRVLVDGVESVVRVTISHGPNRAVAVAWTT